MSQKQFESQHKIDLLAGGAVKMWCLEDLRLSEEGTDESPTKRTLERWISAIPWLKSSHQPNDQLDDLNRPATQLVLDTLVTGARK